MKLRLKFIEWICKILNKYVLEYSQMNDSQLDEVWSAR